MSFAGQLEILLDVSRISNAALSRGLGVDASLISRWKTGNRLPSEIGRTASEIALFVSRTPLRSRDKDALVDILGQESAKAGLGGAIERFLLEIPYQPPVTASQSEADALLCDFSHLLQTSDGVSALGGSINLWPRVRRGQSLEHELYFGIAGRRQAAINVLHAALSPSRPGELYLLSPGGLSWITGDPPTWSVFCHALYAFLTRGGIFRIIHSPHLNDGELIASLSCLLPHYLTGRVFSYALPDRCHDYTPALFIARGLCATLSLRSPGEQMTALYRNDADTSRFEQLFRDYHAEATPLARSHCLGDQLTFESALFELERRGDQDCFIATKSLNPLWMRDPSGNSGVFGEPTAAQSRRREAFLARKSRWVELWPEELIAGIENSGRAPLGWDKADKSPESYISGEALRRYLADLVALLRVRENFKIIITDKLLDTGCLALKHHAGALMLARCASSLCALDLRGEGCLSLLDGWFSARVAQGDPQRVAARLESLLCAMSFAQETA